MQVWFVFSLIFSMFIAAFAVQNSDIVTIKLFFIDYELSQSVVILVSAASGAAIAFFLGLFRRIKLGFKIRELTKNVKNAEKEKQKLIASMTFGNNASASRPPVPAAEDRLNQEDDEDSAG